MKNSLLVILLVLCTSIITQAQNNAPTPAQTLRLARATYEQGRLHEIPTQLNDDVISKMTKQEKVEAYKILCLSYIYLEEPEKADAAMLSILMTDPYFQINPAVDPAEFVALYKTFRRNPIFRVGVQLGGNFTQPNVSEVVNTIYGSSEYKSRFGLQMGFSVDYPLNFISNRLTLHGDLSWQQKKFESTSSNDQGDGEINETIALESQSWLSLPISVQFSLLKVNELKPRKFDPYVSLGVSTDLLIGASINAERTREGETSIEAKNYDVKEQRNTINFSLVGAAGVKTRFAGGLIGIEVRYAYGLAHTTSLEKEYVNTDLFLTYAVPSTIYKINSLSVNATYVQNIFKPKKLTHKK